MASRRQEGSPHTRGEKLSGLPEHRRPRIVRDLSEEEYLTPTLSHQKRRLRYACGCEGSGDTFLFLQGHQKRLQIRSLELSLQPDCGLDRHMGMFASPDYVAIIAREGGYLAIDESGTSSPLRTGWYQMTNPDKAAGPMGHLPDQLRFKLLVLAFHPDLVGAVIEHAGGWSRESAVTFETSPRRLFPAGRQALALLEQGLGALPAIGSTMVVESAAIQFLGLLLSRHPNSLSAGQQHRIGLPTRDARIRQALAYLTAHHQAKVSVQELAHVAGLSRSHLLALFKTEVGMGPRQYVIRYRLRKAADLLQTTGHTVQEVSGLVGFDDPSHFGRLFRRAFGVAPSSLRHRRLT